MKGTLCTLLLSTLLGCFAVSLSGCGGSGFNFAAPLDFPSNPPGGTCVDLEHFPSTNNYAWTIDGFPVSHLVPSSQTDLVGQIHVDESMALTLSNFYKLDCAERLASVQWISTNPDAATVTPSALLAAVFRGVSPGETKLFADVAYKNGGVFRAFPFVGVGGSDLITKVILVP